MIDNRLLCLYSICIVIGKLKLLKGIAFQQYLGEYRILTTSELAKFYVSLDRYWKKVYARISK